VESLADKLALGFSVAFSFSGLWYCLLGAILGTVVGALPGIGPVAAVALLLPTSFSLPPAEALILLAAIYYGAQYGGSTTAILLNLPGEPSSVLTAIDGYRMARRGRGGPALGMAAIASFCAGCVATAIIVLAAPLLGEVALYFRSEDYFSLMVLGLVAACVLTPGAPVPALAMALLGILLGLIGSDPQTAAPRLDMGFLVLSDGINFVSMTIGLFGIAEIIQALETPSERRTRHPVGNVYPSLKDLRRCAGSIARGTSVGSLLGVFPGGGALLASFAAFATETRLIGNDRIEPDGDLRRVAAVEAANNAGAHTSFIPLLTLGLPSNAIMALMVGALMIKGITPGPLVAAQQPGLFWGLIVSMWIGNAMLIVLNLPLLGLWVRVLTIDHRYLSIAIIFFCAMGAYAAATSVAEVYIVLIFGLVGYFFLKANCDPAPLVLGFVLGPLMEEHLRRALLIYGGDPAIFLARPVSAGLMISAVLLLAASLIRAWRLRRSSIEEQGQE